MTAARGPSALDRGLLIAASAANLAGWHDLHLRALGFATEWRDGLWLTPDGVPGIFFHAIAVRPGASPAAVAAGVSRQGWSAVSDPWGDLTLSGVGYTLGGDHAWMVREPDASDPAHTMTGSADSVLVGPEGLIIEAVRDADALADFERTAAIGFGSPVQPAFTWHAPSILLDRRLKIWRGRMDDRTVAVAMAFAEAGVLGVYGVAALPEARRQGIATALMRRTILAGPAIPAVLQPSEMAEGMYLRLGFRRFTTFRSWDRATAANG